MHNPRAEAAKANGCTMETFFEWMRLDDVLDAELTPLGIEQAQQTKLIVQPYSHDWQLIVSSPLSRALQTADGIVTPSSFQRTTTPTTTTTTTLKRISCEYFREVNGDF